MPASTANVTVNYLSRDFQAIRQDLINFARQYHPDKFTFFNDSSPDMLYLEMVAYVGDMLSFYTDKTFNESFRTVATARESLFRIANDLGFFELGATPSETQVVFTTKVPFLADLQGLVKPDPDLLIALEPGTQVRSDSGLLFEILEEVNFADPRNRTVVPNLDSNNEVIDYIVEKTAVAKAGETRIQRFFVSAALAKPFLSVTLDDNDVTEFIGVVSVAGNTPTAPPNRDFTDPDQAFFLVRTLVDNQKFVEINPIDPSEINAFEQSTLRPGAFIDIPRRFIARKDVNDLTTLTFGSNNPDFGNFTDTIETSVDSNTLSLNQVLNNSSLGEIPPPDSTLFIKYRVGGGTSTNVVAGQLNTIATRAYVPAPGTVDLQALQQVRNTLRVRNDLPAVGGTDIPTNEEIRHFAGKIFSTQSRAVTEEDVKALIQTMPPEFGRPSKISYEEIKPRVSNFSQMRNGLNTLLFEMAFAPDQTGRLAKLTEIGEFLNQLQNGVAYLPVDDPTNPIAYSETSANLLSATPTLWLGEKARLHILSIDEDAHFISAAKDENGIFVSPQEALKLNMRNFLRPVRVIGDWIDIVDAKITNVQVEFTVMVDKKNKQQVLIEALNKMKDYFAIENWQLGQPIFIANVSAILQELDGVINVVDLKFYNVFDEDLDNGRQYAIQEIGRYFNIDPVPVNTQNNKFLMTPVNGTLLQTPDSIFEVKFEDVDIIGKAI